MPLGDITDRAEGGAGVVVVGIDDPGAAGLSIEASCGSLDRYLLHITETAVVVDDIGAGRAWDALLHELGAVPEQVAGDACGPFGSGRGLSTIL